MLVGRFGARLLRTAALLAACGCTLYDARLTSRDAAPAVTTSASGAQSVSMLPVAQAGGVASTPPLPAATTPGTGGVPAPPTSLGSGLPPIVSPPRFTDEDDAGMPSPDPRAPAPRSDDCPDDPAKLTPGECGCGVPEPDPAAAASCKELRAALLHRYSFDGSTNVARDLVAQADAVIQGTSLTGSGSLRLQTGAARQYVVLPSGLLARQTSVTIELWLQPDSSDSSARIFDFTDRMPAPASPLPAPPLPPPPVPPLLGMSSSLNLRTYRGAPRAGVLVAGSPEVIASAAAPLASGRLTQLAVVVDTSQMRLRLYVDGKPAADSALTAPLSQLHDTNNWLGSSPLQPDQSFGCSLTEFRIYGSALGAAALATSFAAGPDSALFSVPR